MNTKKGIEKDVDIIEKFLIKKILGKGIIGVATKEEKIKICEKIATLIYKIDSSRKVEDLVKELSKIKIVYTKNIGRGIF